MKKLIVLLVAAAVAGVLAGYLERQSAAEAAPSVYVVQDGDTVWDLSRKIADSRQEDVRDTVDRIMADNDIEDDAIIHPGQKIVIK